MSTGIATLNGNVTSPTATSIDFSVAVPVGARLLIDEEVVLVGTLSSGTTYNVTRAYNGTTGATHTSGAQCYSVVKVQNTGSIMVYYVDETAGTTLLLSISVTEDAASGDTVTLTFAAPTELTDNTSGAADATLDANTAALTDSTGGTPSATTLVTVGVTNTGDVSTAIKNNFATLNQLINARDVVLRDNIASLNAQVNALAAAVADMTGSVN